MDKHETNLLVVDDEEFNRAILQKILSDAGYAVTPAEDGEAAWKLLQGGKYDFAAVLLDRIMPRLDGMGLLARMKSDARLARLPVIFQTAITDPAGIAEGMKAGAFYYLTKPINREVMLAVVQSAVNEHAMTRALRYEATEERRRTFSLLRRMEFSLRSLAEARMLATTLAGCYPDPQRILLGITELMINAIEHGNLGISYQEKSTLLQEARWEEEVERRLGLPENAGKEVHVTLEHLPDAIRLTITDCGNGFDWTQYLEMSPQRAFDPNGRGIAMSRMMSFDTLGYPGKGNQVVATVRL